MFPPPVLMTETEAFIYVKDLDGAKRLINETVSYEFYSNNNVKDEKLLTGRKITYSDWDANAGKVKLVEITDEYVDFETNSTNYYAYLGEFGELQINLPFKFFFDEWDPETNTFKKRELMSDFIGAGYKGFLAQDRQETYGLYENGYRTGIDVRHINLAAPQYYTLERIRDLRNSEHVKIGYTTEFYNDGRNLTREETVTTEPDQDTSGWPSWVPHPPATTTTTTVSTAAYTSTTIFKRDSDGYLVGQTTLTLIPGKGFKFENVLSYNRDAFGRIQGMTKLTSAGTDAYYGKPSSIIVERITSIRDPVTHLKIGETTEQWTKDAGGADRWFKYSSEAADNIIFNITIDVQKITDPVTGEEKIIKVNRTVDYKRQLQWEIPPEVWAEMLQEAMGDLEGRIDIADTYNGYQYVYTTSNDWRETVTTFTSQGRLLSEDIIVTLGWKKGVYLPEVATETGWDPQTFFKSCALEKAGLAEQELSKATIEVFQTEGFES